MIKEPSMEQIVLNLARKNVQVTAYWTFLTNEQ